ncbi:histidine kinase [bacterium SCSIO 12741]|nr:histidine kinase [bacterium SCSIO 12741]
MKHYNRDNGLTGDVTFDVVPDDHGMLWINVANYVVRFDGEDFMFPLFGNFDQRAIPRLYKGESGKIWVQSLSGDLGWFRTLGRPRLMAYAYNDSIKHLTAENQVQSMKILKDETLLIGTKTKGLFEVSPEGRVKEVIGLQSGYHGYVIMELEKDAPLVFSIFDSTRQGTPFQVSYLNNTGDLRFQFSIPDITFGNRSILLKRNDSTFLFSTGGEQKTIAEFTSSGLLQTYQAPTQVNGILQDGKGGLWVGSMDNGLTHYPGGKIDESLGYRYLNDIKAAYPAHEDHEGGIWVTTYGHGLYHIPHPSYVSFDWRKEEVNTRVNLPRVTSDGKRIIFMDSENHLGVFEPHSSPQVRYLYFDESPVFPHTIEDIYYDTHFQNCWVGTSDGLFLMDPDKQEYSLPVKGLPANLETPILMKQGSQDSTIILITKHQYFVLIKDSVVFKSRQFPTDITDVIHLSPDQAWISDKEDTWFFDGQNLNSLNEQFPDEAPLENASLEYENGRLWIAPEGLKLRMVENGKISTIWAKDGYAVSYVRSLFKDDLGQINGISMDGHYVIQTDKKGSTNFPVKMYMQDFEVVMPFQWRGTELEEYYYSGTPTGLTRFEKIKYDQDEKQLPKVLINRIRINERDTIVKGNYELEYDQNFIGIDFSGLTFQQLNYSPMYITYMMEGVDKDWKDTKKRTLEYTTLPPGTYQFKIKARLGSAPYSDPEIIQFVISPPYWETWWFRSIWVIVGLLIIYVLFTYRLRQLKEKERLKTAREVEVTRLELRALKAQLNPHFIFNSITSAQYYLSKNQPKEAENYLLRFSQLMRKVLNHSEATQVSLKDEISLMQEYISIESERFSGEPIQFEVNSNRLDLSSCMILPALFQPYIENAIWHGLRLKQGERKITLDLETQDEHLIIKISDNGIGREIAKSRKTSSGESKSFGMLIASRRVKLMNNNLSEANTVQIIDLKDVHGNAIGTQVCLTLPLHFQTA